MFEHLTAAVTAPVLYPSMEALSRRLAESVKDAVELDLQEHGRATLVLSGGNTPREYLKDVANARQDWSNVAITLSDERFVATDHRDSNEAMIREFFSETAAEIIGLRGIGATPGIAARDAGLQLRGKCLWPASVSILGFGTDGHFASLFTDADCNSEDENGLIATVNPQNNTNRISMTFDQLLRSKNIVIACNTAKLEFLDLACADRTEDAAPVVRFLETVKSRVQVLATSG